ncbi:MAG TPA: hypothetical protein PLW21_04470 [Methanothrix sp.]|nr:hypothetical protein [Methanothrix sp.]
MSLWGETIRKIIFALAMALAVFAVPAMAQCGSSEVLEMGVYETATTAFTIPAKVDVNHDQLITGQDVAIALVGGQAENKLKIKKNQDSGDTDCCAPVGGGCNDCGNKVNVEDLRVAGRVAIAVGFNQFGPSRANNNVEIVTNQC